ALWASVARYIRIGIATIPKLIAPRHIDRAISRPPFAELPGLYRRFGANSKRCLDPGRHPLCIQRSQLLVLEVEEDVLSLRQEAGDSSAPQGEALSRIRFPTKAKIDEGAAPERARLWLAVPMDQCGTDPLQLLGDRRDVPRGMPELE